MIIWKPEKVKIDIRFMDGKRIQMLLKLDGMIHLVYRILKQEKNQLMELSIFQENSK
jgi:hypothetical protein